MCATATLEALTGPPAGRTGADKTAKSTDAPGGQGADANDADDASAEDKLSSSTSSTDGRGSNKENAPAPSAKRKVGDDSGGPLKGAAGPEGEERAPSRKRARKAPPSSLEVASPSSQGPWTDEEKQQVGCFAFNSRLSLQGFSNTRIPDTPNRQYLDGAAVFGNRYDEIHRQYIPTRTPDEIMAYSMAASVPRRRSAPAALTVDHAPKRKRAAAAATKRPPASAAQAPAPVAGDGPAEPPAAPAAEDFDVPAFLSCSSCGLVFVDEAECSAHESSCHETGPASDEDAIARGGRLVAGNARECALHILRHQISTGSPVTAHDRIYFRQAGDDDDGGGAVEYRPAAPAPEARAEEQSGPDPAVMERVRSLCSTSVDPSTGLPSERITVMDDDETLYDFAVEVRTSSIPNAGHGAFLTYLGARVLRPEASARSARLLRGCYVDEDSAGSAIIPTRNTATARTPDGRMMKVTVTGENLHYNDNYRCVLCFVFLLLLLFGAPLGRIYIWECVPTRSLPAEITPCARKFFSESSSELFTVLHLFVPHSPTGTGRGSGSIGCRPC